MKKHIAFILILLFSVVNLHAQFIESQILGRGGIKSLAMANAISAKSGENEFFTESPASPSDLEVPYLSLNYGDITGFNNFLNISYSHPTLRGVISGNIKYFNAHTQNSGLNNAININLNFSKTFTEKVFIGLGIKFITADYFNQNSSGFGVNIGAIYHFYEYTRNRSNKILENIKIGLSFLNLGYPLSFDDDFNATPVTIKTGPSFILNFSPHIKNISSLDLEFTKFKDIDVNIGLENIFYNKYILRLGYSIDSAYQDFSGGLGYKFKIKNINAEADYSICSVKKGDVLHYLGMEMQFGQKDTEPPATKIDFNLEDVSPNYDGKADYLIIKPQINDNKILKSWDIKITDNSGNTVKQYESPDLDTLKGKLTFQKVFTRLFEKEKEAPVPEEIIWDGIDQNGKDVPDGSYKVILTAKDDKENLSSPVEKSFNLDKTPPEVKITYDNKIFSPNGDGSKDTIKFKFDLKTEKNDNWFVKIINANNEIVRSYKWKGNEIKEIEWDGKDNQNALIPDGNYDLIIEGSDPAQNSVKANVNGITLTTAKQSIAVSSSLDEFSPNGDGKFDQLKFELYSSDTSGLDKWKLSIRNESGDEVKTFEGMSKIPVALDWDGTDNNSNLLMDGTYLYKLEAWYNSGNHPESFVKKLRIDNTPPAVDLNIDPIVFSPDEDGIDDTETLKLTIKDSSEINKWSLTILENNDQTTFKKLEQQGMPATEIKWNGLSDSGKLVQSKNKYFIVFEIEDKTGNKAVIKGKEIKISTEPPDIDFDYEPQLFSPDDDGEGDFLSIKLYSYNNKKIKNWKLNIYPIRSGKRESLFMDFSSTNLPNKSLIWNGKNKKGELVESAMDYEMDFIVEDILGNVKTITKTLNVDILVIKTPYGLKIKISNIEFEYNKADLIGNAFKILDNVSKKLNKYITYKIIIEGHTDSIGGEEYNLKLSEKRAESVFNYMVDTGIDMNRLSKKGLGLSRPVAPNTNPDGSDNPEGRAKNRRVEFLLVKPGAKVTPE
ncbi:MAG: gliding motility-associated C-terminal domain-containing protein [bacterium]|nr:gliding motility-associated C-terminal domain-containing protein [bacterium]